MKLTNILLAIICLLLLWILSLQYKTIEHLEVINENSIKTAVNSDVIFENVANIKSLYELYGTKKQTK